MHRIHQALFSFHETIRLSRDELGLKGSGAVELPATPLECIGDANFLKTHGCKFPYIGGAMANGIASTDLVIALVRAGFLGIFGAAGLPVQKVEAAIATLQNELGTGAYGFNLIHSPQEPELEEHLANLFLKKGFKCMQ